MNPTSNHEVPTAGCRCDACVGYARERCKEIAMGLPQGALSAKERERIRFNNLPKLDHVRSTEWWRTMLERQESKVDKN